MMPFCSSVLPLGGILMSTWMFASFSYLWTPAAAIFQNSLVLFVTNASFSAEGSDALKIWTDESAEADFDAELVELAEPDSLLDSLLLHPASIVPTTTHSAIDLSA